MQSCFNFWRLYDTTHLKWMSPQWLDPQTSQFESLWTVQLSQLVHSSSFLVKAKLLSCEYVAAVADCSAAKHSAGPRFFPFFLRWEPTDSKGSLPTINEDYHRKGVEKECDISSCCKLLRWSRTQLQFVFLRYIPIYLIFLQLPHAGFVPQRLCEASIKAVTVALARRLSA